MSEVSVLLSVTDQLALVEKLRRNGAYDEALALCQDLVSEAPDDPAPLVVAAAISRDAGRPDLGLPLLERATRLAPDRSDLFCDLGALLLDLGEDAGAEEAYKRAVAADAACRVARTALCEMFEAQGRLDAAAAQLDELVAAAPVAFDMRERLAHLLDRAGNGQRAADVRRETMRLARDSVRDSYERILRHSADTPVYAVDEARLSWSYALLTYAAAGTELARAAERTDLRKAVASYRAMLRVLADAADQALHVDGLRRTYETAASAFAHCHSKLAALQETFGNSGGAVYHLEEAIRARRGPSDEDRARLGEIARRCAPDIAGIRDAVAAYHGRMPPPAAIPITRWDFVRHAREWVAVAAQARGRAHPPQRRHIAVAAFNAHHIQLFFAVACVLFSRGHTVDLVWLPCLAFDRSCDPEPVYDGWEEVTLAQEMSAFADSDLPDGLRLVDLRDVALAPATPAFEAVAERQAFVDLRNHYRDSSLDIAAEPWRTRMRNRVRKNLDAIRRLETYFDDAAAERVILFNAGVIEYGAAFHAARAAGVTVVAWEQSAHRHGQYLLSVNRTHGEFDLCHIWQTDAPHILDDMRRNRVRTWMAEKDSQASRDPVPRGRHRLGEAARSLLEALGLDSDKATAVLFPNITWDTAALDRERAFASVADWVVRTVAFFAEHPAWQLIVRAHPAETVRSDEFVGKILRTRWPEMPPNIRIVESENPLSSYRLLDAAQFGLYYTGSLGFEMAMAGIQAITPARPLFGGIGFTREVETEDAYFEAIRRAFDDPVSTAVTAEEVDRAWCFADLYLNDVPKALPWSYQRFWPSILEDWPMARVLGADGARFDRVFAVFAGEIELPDGIVGRLDEADRN